MSDKGVSMQGDTEKLARLIYKRWKAHEAKAIVINHPGEECLVCFLENRLSVREKMCIKNHLFYCDLCLESVINYFKISLLAEEDVSFALISKAKGLKESMRVSSILEICLRFEDKAKELLLNVSGVNRQMRADSVCRYNLSGGCFDLGLASSRQESARV